MMDVSTVQFDVEGGYFVESPCRNCPFRDHLPHCADDCRILAQVQTHLAGIISCSNQIVEGETYSLAQ